jgi:predicted HAD superfamily phosphohydrolase YqeG
MILEMPKYDLCDNAGEVAYKTWAQFGVELPILDMEGTLTSYGSTELNEDVIAGLERQGIADIFPRGMALVSNSKDPNNPHVVGDALASKLDMQVLTLCVGDGYKRKPNPEMGLKIVSWTGLKPEQLGVVGDRRLVDVRFGQKLGAGAIALTRKVGKGDARWVPTFRKIESDIVTIERGMRKVEEYPKPSN